MDILDSSLANEIALIQAAPKEASYYWTAQFHVENENYEVVKVLSIDTIQDYESSYSDTMMVKLVVLGGTYTYRLIPNLAKLELTLYKSPVSEVYGTPIESRSNASERYIATILNAQASAIESNGMNMPTEQALNLTNLLNIEVQLISKPMDQMRMRSVGGNYRNATVEDVIKSVLTLESGNIEVTEGLAAGVEMLPSTNTKKREHVILPQGLRLVDAPSYIHEKCGGVYGTGFAYYYQSPYWYVFPPYNSSNFYERQKTLTAVRIPANRFPGAERSYRINGNSAIIMVTGEVRTKATGEISALNQGNGVRFADADQYMGNFVKTEDNRALASRGATNNEFITSARPSGNNNVQISPNRITSNALSEYSQLAARDGDLVGLSWENSNPSLIYPGMPVKILYLDGEDIKELFGLVIKAHHYTSTVGPGYTSSRHLSTTNLTVFAKRIDSPVAQTVP